MLTPLFETRIYFLVVTEDIWEVASKTQFIDNRTWESFGHPFPDKELPFLSELGVESHLWTDYVVALQNSISFDKTPIKIKIQNQKSFTKDVKYMLGIVVVIFCCTFETVLVFVLVGIASKTFLLVDDWFVLNSDISLSNFTPTTVKEFVKELTFCGSCYRALNLFVTPNEATGKYRENGYIFAVSFQITFFF